MFAAHPDPLIDRLLDQEIARLENVIKELEARQKKELEAQKKEFEATIAKLKAEQKVSLVV
jgi:uncharacterized membrane protein (DUF106 family)